MTPGAPRHARRPRFSARSRRVAAQPACHVSPGRSRARSAPPPRSRVPAVGAKPPAPGAPGASAHLGAGRQARLRHRPPARRATRTLTLRQASLSEVYYPDLCTPAFRGLQFAVTRRQTLPRPRDGRRRPAPHRAGRARRARRASSRSPARSASARSTETPRWRLTKTWITDPARATRARARALRVAAPASRCGCTCSPTRRRATTATTTAGPAPRRLLAWDDDAASAVAADAARCARDDERLPRDGERPVARPAGRRRLARLRRGAARQRRAGRADARSTACGNRDDDAGDRLRRDAGAARRDRRRARCDAASTPRCARFDGGWRAYLRLAGGAARDASRRRAAAAALRAVADGARRVGGQAHRGASIAAPNMPWVWGTLTLAGDGVLRPVPPRLAARLLPRGHRAEGGRRRRRRDAAARLPVARPEARRLVVAEHAVDGDAVLDEPAARRGRAAGRARLVARAHAAPSDWRTSAPAADFIVAERARDADQERWENQNGWSPNTIATEIAGADLRRRHRAGERRPRRAPRRTRRRPTTGRRRSSRWTATTQRPVLAEAVLPAGHQGRRPGRRHAPTRSATTSRARSTSARSSTTRSSGSCCSASSAGTTRRCSTRCAVGDAQLARRHAAAGRIWHRFTFDGYGETADGGDWDIFPTAGAPDARARVAAARRASAASTSCSPAATPRRTCGRSPSTANDGLMLPEQVWDGRAPDAGRARRRGHALGARRWRGRTRSSSGSRGRSHAGEPIERPAIVACRYTGEAAEPSRSSGRLTSISVEGLMLR